jgi:leucyl aminopeptidase
MPLTITLDHAPSLAAVDASGPTPAPSADASATELPERLVAIGVRAGSIEADAPGADVAVLAATGFTAKLAQTVLAVTDAGPRLLVGLGEPADAGSFRRVGAAVARAARGVPHVAVDALGPIDAPQRAAAAEALAEGLALGSYAFTRYKDRPAEARLARATVLGAGGRKVADAVTAGGRMAAAVALARDLVNTPGGDLTPAAFAELAVDVARDHGLHCEVLDRKAIAREGLGGLLGVNRGSMQEPRLVTLTHDPERARGHVALVGKGITFDAGGLSIKTSAGMEWMKTDMAGGAAVLAAMTLVPVLAPRTRVTAFIPLTDNMLGPDATRVGDVLRTRSGKTIEVLNTDAEGRLILADGLTLAVEAAPDAIVDVATLTGACMVALGDRTAGMMANHDGLAQRVADAAAEAGEALWRLPMPDHLRASLDSEVADLRNIGTGAYGGALVAAIFLREFVGNVPWVHLDIAGPSNTTSGYDEVTKGGTGYGVRTLARLVAGWTRLPRA